MTAVLRELARRYEKTRAGRTGSGKRDLLLDYEELLRSAGCKDGDSRIVAERDLRDAQRSGILYLESHARDPGLILRVRFASANERDLYQRLGDPSPCVRRQKDAAVFAEARNVSVPEYYRGSWLAMCDRFERAALNGSSLLPFFRDDREGNLDLLQILAKVLDWKGESLIRFASCVTCGDSKRLANLQPRLEQLLSSATAGKITRLDELGIVENPHSTLVHGPLRLLFNGRSLDLGLLHGATMLSIVDLARITGIETGASQCLTIENETVLLELAKLQSGVVLVGTNGYASSATLTLLKALPDYLEFVHFGDADPPGFDILRDLRERSELNFRSLHMRYRPRDNAPSLTTDDRRLIDRLLTSPSLTHEEKDQLKAMLQSGNKGDFEQESLGRPSLQQFPFFIS